MRVLIATDAWHPQVNGVVRSIEALRREAPALGAEILPLTPEGWRTVGLPTYPDIRLALVTAARLGPRIEASAADHVHVATEGPVGLAARRHCLRVGRPFTTSYHTQFPDYLAARLPVPRALSYAWLRRFHNAGRGTMVATASLADDLAARGFSRLMRWSRGVDHALFRPRERVGLDLPRPIFLSVGRVAVEKNVEAFLRLDLPGTKVVVGDGPARADLEARYPAARFLGTRTGESLAEIYASADVFVFPSRTDTFGNVMLEALASGTPVAAYPVPGPRDVLADGDAGVMRDDLGEACRAALAVPRERARAFSLRYTWSASARQFLANVASARAGARA
ncbi:glycosyltransferase family 4 protein [Lichenibacterium dinghuense]|uniref:glycosyltransferase family 4 protein n=1 Tax=Lichenibacterium dinghuense TaxID=2895977 RepID=UPI001F2B972A|nr:glycosyltransferase family 1 protein [Lichenibacterium sp. 6Y81]